MTKMLRVFVILSFLFSNFINAQHSTDAGVFKHTYSIEGEADLSYLLGSVLPSNSPYRFPLLICQESKSKDQHCRYQVQYAGIPFKSLQILSHHYQRSDRTDFVISAPFPLDWQKEILLPSISLEGAIEIAKKEVPSTAYTFVRKSADSSEKGLLFVPEKYDFKKPNWTLAYEIDVHSKTPHTSKRVTIDAYSGEIIFVENRLCSLIPGTAVTQYHGTQVIETTEENGGYVMNDQTRGTGIRTYNQNTGSLFFDEDNYWDNNNDEMDHVAGDVHWGSGMTYDFYVNTLGLDGLDSQGAGIECLVHLNAANAYWDGFQTLYGDGLEGFDYDMPFTHISIVGHEITHAVTQYHSGLVYSGESGGLNESISDIIGMAVQNAFSPDDFNWQLGDDVSSNGSYFRNMANPKEVDMADTYNGEYWESWGDPHYTSSIGNFWYYLLVTGGTGTNDNGYTYDVPSIGWEAATQIATDTWVYHLTGSSDYPTCANATLQVVSELYGSCGAEYQAVLEAWKAVGLLGNLSVQDFSASSNYICEIPGSVSFSTIGDVTDHSWDFGDGNTSNESNPVHEYSANGVYTVSLSGVDCDDMPFTITKPDLITVDDGATNCDTIYMEDNLSMTSENCIGVLTDDGGDGNYSNGVDAEVIVDVSGTPGYIITIHSFHSESCCDDLLIQADYGNGFEFAGFYAGTYSDEVIEIYAERIRFVWDTDGSVVYSGFVISWQCITPVPPTADFSAASTTICDSYGLFTDESAGFPDSWTWLIDNVSASTEQNPILEFPAAGTYDVGLIACNDLGCDTTVYEDYITFDPTLEFCDTIYMVDNLLTTSSSCSGVLIDNGGIDGNYSNSIDAVLTIDAPNGQGYAININNFQSESCCDDLYIYADYGAGFSFHSAYAGSYSDLEIEIIAERIQFIWDTDGSVTASGFVINWQCLVPTQPVADFSAFNTLVCNGSGTFYDESSGFPDSWIWLIDNVEVSTEQNPTVAFPDAGTYDVGLIACNDLGCDTLVVEDYITVDPTMEFCDTIVMEDDLFMTVYSCTGTLVDDGGIDNPYDNNVYAVLSVEVPDVSGYLVSLNSFESQSCCDDLYIYADYGFGYTFHSAYAGSYEDLEVEILAESIRFIWDTNNFTTYDGFEITWECLVPSLPEADFGTEDEVICGGFGQFTDESSGFPDSWTWLINNVPSSTQQNPLLQFADAGIYDIGLIACNDFGCDTIIYENLITYDPTLEYCDTVTMEDNLIMTTNSCTGVIIDDGGTDGSYSNGVYAQLDITNTGAIGYQLSFDEFISESCCDYFQIYADFGSGFEYYDGYSGNQSGEIVTIYGSEHLRIVWSTDGSVTNQGFIVTWQCLANDIAPIIDPHGLVENCSRSVNFLANTPNADEVHWDFGDGHTDTGEDVWHSFTETGEHTISVEATNEFGTTQESFTIMIEYEGVGFEVENEVLVDTELFIHPYTHEEFDYWDIVWFVNGEEVDSEYELALTMSTLGENQITCFILDAMGCTSTHTEIVSVVTAISVSEKELENILLIFPNPTQSQLNIRHLSKLKGILEISLYNNIGVRSLHIQPEEGTDSVTLDLEQLPAGVYLLKVEGEGSKAIYKKVIKV